jgi:uncharacterized membrane protein
MSAEICILIFAFCAIVASFFVTAKLMGSEKKEKEDKNGDDNRAP